nr:hypothetical protein Itr_chr07CG17320 [Ipomoea trifida]
MAAEASSLSRKVTKPKERCFCVAWSSGVFTSLMSPNGMKAACKIASFTSSANPPAVAAAEAEFSSLGMAGADGSISPMKNFSMSSLALLLCPASSKSSVASFPKTKLKPKKHQD